MVKKVKGKRGASLVEEVCAVAILSIVVVGLLSAIGVAHASVVLYNAHDKASAQVEKISDRLMTVLAQSDYDNMPDGYHQTKDVIADSEAVCKSYRYANSNLQRDKLNRPYYFYEKVSFSGIYNNDPWAGQFFHEDTYPLIKGYKICVVQHYSKTKYVRYNSFVRCSGEDEQ